MTIEDEWVALLDMRDRLQAAGVLSFDEAARSMLDEVYRFMRGDAGWVMLAHQTLPEEERAADPLSGWRTRHFARIGPRATAQTVAIQGWIERRQLLVDPVTQMVLERAGEGARAYWLRAPGVVDWDAGPTHPTIELNTLLGIRDRVWGAETIHEKAEVWLGVDLDETEFAPEAVDTLKRALRIFRPTLVRWATIFGLRGAHRPLSPREREVLEYLLAGRTEAEIADKIGLTPGSVHQVAQRVYRKFEVNSRGELHALCAGVPLEGR